MGVRNFVENKSSEVCASNRRSRLSRLVCSLRKQLSELEHSAHYLVEIENVLQYPLLYVSLFALDVYFVLPFGVLSVAVYGALGVLFLVASQAPIIYMVAKKAWRELHMLPMGDSWETSPERFNKVFNEYVESAKKRKG